MAKKYPYGFDGWMILNFKNLDVCNLLIPSNGQSIWPFMFCIYCVKRLSWNSTTLANLVDNQSEEFFLQEGRVLGSFVDFFLEVFTKFKISCFFYESEVIPAQSFARHLTPARDQSDIWIKWANYTKRSFILSPIIDISVNENLFMIVHENSATLSPLRKW